MPCVVFVVLLFISSPPVALQSGVSLFKTWLEAWTWAARYFLRVEAETCDILRISEKRQSDREMGVRGKEDEEGTGMGERD